MQLAAPSPETISRDDVLARARALVPMLAARAGETENNRSVLPDVHAALADAGLYRILLAPRLGGLGLDMRTHLEVAAELARGCASTAWVQSLGGYQNFLVGWYPPEAQDEVRADGRPLFSGLVMGPPETAATEAGGVRLSGRWPYVSGIDHASWLLLSARDPDAPAGKPRVLTCLIPRGEVVIDDDWHAMGMRGTGSKSALLDRVFVPAHRVMSFRDVEGRPVPGSTVNAGPLYRGLPTSILFGMVVGVPALGIAESAIETYRERLRTRSNPRMPSAQTEWPSSQMRLGRARTRLDAARLAFFDTVDAFSARVDAGVAPAADERMRWRMTVVETVATCTAVVYELFSDAGTGVSLDGNALQRAFRDIHVLRSHFMLTPDLTAENAGRIQLGLAPKPPFL